MYSRIKLKTETDVVAPKDLDMCRSQELDPSRPSRAERLRRLGMGWGASMELEKKEKHCCWWNKSCTSWYGQTTIIYMVLSCFIHLRCWGNKGWPFWGSEAENEQNLSSTTSYFQALAMNSLVFLYLFNHPKRASMTILEQINRCRSPVGTKVGLGR